MSDTTLKQLLDEKAVVASLQSFVRAVDERDWDGVREGFAPTVLFDMRSAGTGPAVDAPADEIIGMMKSTLAHLEAVHHQLGNLQVTVEDGEADIFCYGTASHYLPNPDGRNTRTFVGTYEFHLVQAEGSWRVDRMRFDQKFISGNMKLEASAERT